MRCPDGVGAFSSIESFTPSAPNACGGPVIESWPGSAAVDVTDLAGMFGTDVSGVAFDPADASTLWVVRNPDGRLFKLKKQGDWGYADGWDGGVLLKDASGGGTPDAEGVVVGPDGADYVSSERDQVSSRPARTPCSDTPSRTTCRAARP